VPPDRAPLAPGRGRRPAADERPATGHLARRLLGRPLEPRLLRLRRRRAAPPPSPPARRGRRPAGGGSPFRRAPPPGGVPGRAGRPTGFFRRRGGGALRGRSAAGRRRGLGAGPAGRLFAAAVIGGPLPWLFPPPFVRGVILPMLRAVGAL